MVYSDKPTRVSKLRADWYDLYRKLEKKKRKTKIGDHVRVLTLKAISPSTGGRNCSGVRRMGTVVAKYDRFAIVELRNGVREAFLWLDLIEREEGQYDWNDRK